MWECLPAWASLEPAAYRITSLSVDDESEIENKECHMIVYFSLN